MGSLPRATSSPISMFRSNGANLPRLVRGGLPDGPRPPPPGSEPAGRGEVSNRAASLEAGKPGGGYGGNHDRWLDLRIDHSDTPIEDLSGLFLDPRHIVLRRARKKESSWHRRWFARRFGILDSIGGRDPATRWKTLQGAAGVAQPGGAMGGDGTTRSRGTGRVREVLQRGTLSENDRRRAAPAGQRVLAEPTMRRQETYHRVRHIAWVGLHEPSPDESRRPSRPSTFTSRRSTMGRRHIQTRAGDLRRDTLVATKPARYADPWRSSSFGEILISWTPISWGGPARRGKPAHRSPAQVRGRSRTARLRVRLVLHAILIRRVRDHAVVSNELSRIGASRTMVFPRR